MRLSPETFKVLENFTKINPSIVLQPGKQIVTINIHGSVLATASIEEYLEYELPITDLKAFLQTLSLFEDPEIEVDSDKYMTIRESNGTANCHFHFGNKSLIKQPPVDHLTLANVNITFPLDQKTLNAVTKAAGVFRLEHVCIYNDGDKIMFGVTNPEKPDQNTYNACVGEWSGPDFRLFMRLDNLNLLPGDYAVSIEIGEYQMCEFKRTDDQLTYWVSLDDTSEYG